MSGVTNCNAWLNQANYSAAIYFAKDLKDAAKTLDSSI